MIVERYIRERTLPLLDKTKFLVPYELTLGQFLCLLRYVICDSQQVLLFWFLKPFSSPASCQICHSSPCLCLPHILSFFVLKISVCLSNCLPSRNKIALDSTQALFLLVAEKSMSCMSSNMGEVYTRYRDGDGFLYITYASQEMFGAPLQAAKRPCWAWKVMKRTDLWPVETPHNQTWEKKDKLSQSKTVPPPQRAHLSTSWNLPGLKEITRVCGKDSDLVWGNRTNYI